jgi:hypothetical protein
MDFHLAFTPKPLAEKINHRQKLLLMGSCFTENIGTKLKQHKFEILENPNGILFNPVSITQSLNNYIDNKHYNAKELFYENECWNSWQHHSRFSHPDKALCLKQINQSQQQAHTFLQKAEWVLVTLGSAFVYTLNFSDTSTAEASAGVEGMVVANCHKVPTDKFNKRLLGLDEITTALLTMLDKLKAFNPFAKIIFTISPVRHLRDGFTENNRSKARLIEAVHSLTETKKNIFYFPAYELVMDDLRDYRFYAEDMVHPNYAATNYVWQKFTEACIDEPTQKLMKEINTINAAKSHKPFNPASAQHKQFLQTNLGKVNQLSRQYPYIDFEEERIYFASCDRNTDGAD